MKKVLIVLAILVLGYVFISKKQDYYIIPDDSIRFRVIANSNSVYDKYVKIKVKESLEQSFYDDLSNSTSIEESRHIITNNIEEYKSIVRKTLNDLSYDEGFTINYGLNYFPEKEYNDVIYEEGNYESLVITIGKGEGENFWCVLFPPICTLEAEETDDIEYRFLIKDLFDKYILNK